MDRFELFKALKRDEGGKMLMLVMDGLGGLPNQPGGKTALETAAEVPYRSRPARRITCGA